MVWPSPHPALDINRHLVPGIERFLKYGEGLGLESLSWKTFSADAALKYAKSLAHPSTLERFSNHVQHWYISNDPLNSSLGAVFWISIAVFLAAEITGNYSQVDRLWTFLPVIFSAHFALYNHVASHGVTKKLFSWTGARGVNTWQTLLVPEGVDPRMFLVLCLQILWSTRLTINAFRRGFFKIKGLNFIEEDYRWPELRKSMSKFQYKVFAFVFIAFIQIILLWATALPQYLLLTSRPLQHPSRAPPPLGWPDFLLAAMYIGLLALEQLGDHQQQQYQNWKRSPEATSTPGKAPEQVIQDRAKVHRGFRTDGLFAWSRHPAWACEMSHWYILYAFTLRATVPTSVWTNIVNAFQKVLDQAINKQTLDSHTLSYSLKQAGPHLINYSLIGPLCYTLLFYGSGPFSEAMSAKKYPLYKEYKKRVAMYWPADTVLKIVLLAVTGRLKKVNNLVFGDAALAEKPKRK